MPGVVGDKEAVADPVEPRVTVVETDGADETTGEGDCGWPPADETALLGELEWAGVVDPGDTPVVDDGDDTFGADVVLPALR